jgi:hypothetical protein
MNNRIQQIRERLQRIDSGEVNFNWHNWSSGDIRILLDEIDRLKETSRLVIADCESIGIEPFHLDQLRGEISQGES